MPESLSIDQADSAAGDTAFWYQPVAERLLGRAVMLNRLSRSFLLTGPEGVGKWAAAFWLAKNILHRSDDADGDRIDACTHPDWHVLFAISQKNAEKDIETVMDAKRGDPFAVVHLPQRPYITIDRIRHLIEDLGKTSVEGGAKVTLIAGAEQMAGDVQSILLKTIEEPPPNSYFILTSSDPGRLLPTVVSRCQSVRFAPVDPSVIADRLIREFGIDPNEAQRIAVLAGGGWGNAMLLSDSSSITWQQTVTELWNEAFRIRPSALVSRISESFTTRGRGGAFDRVQLACDVWCSLLRRDCALAAAGHRVSTGAPIDRMESGWTCWRILRNGRASLYVNVAARLAVTGTFLSLRRHLGCL